VPWNYRERRHPGRRSQKSPTIRVIAHAGIIYALPLHFQGCVTAKGLDSARVEFI